MLEFAAEKLSCRENNRYDYFPIPIKGREQFMSVRMARFHGKIEISLVGVAARA